MKKIILLTVLVFGIGAHASVGTGEGKAKAALYDEKGEPKKFFSGRGLGVDDAEWEAMYYCEKERKSELNEYCKIVESGILWY